MTTPRSFLDSVHPVPPHLHISDETAGRLIAAKVEAIRSHFAQCGITQAVMGLLGDVSSAVAMALTVRALGSENVIVFKATPYSPFQEAIATALVNSHVVAVLGIPDHNDNSIFLEQPVVVTRDNNARFSPVSYARRAGDILARERANVLMDAALELDALVVGSLNLTEHQLGAYVQGGDDVSGLEPVRDLFQTEVYQIASRLGLPESVLLSPPRVDFGADCVTADVATYFTTIWEPTEALERMVELNFDPELVKNIVAQLERAVFQRKAPCVLKTHRQW
jgi:NAD+ synthetase